MLSSSKGQARQIGSPVQRGVRLYPIARIVRARLANQLDLHRPDLGVGRRLGLPEDLFAHCEIKPPFVELGEDAFFGFGAGGGRSMSVFP
jgi:hypothetical protein